jgi:hypothetical protein
MAGIYDGVSCIVATFLIAWMKANKARNHEGALSH